MIKKILIIFTLFLLSVTGVFACINDSYTVINEKMWSENYKEILFIGIVNIIAIMGIYLTFLLNTINTYKKNNKFNISDINNTVYKIMGVFIAVMFYVFPFSSLQYAFLLIALIAFLIPYILFSITNLKKKKLAIFLIMLIAYIPINLGLVLLFDTLSIDKHNVNFTMSIGNIIYGYLLLLIPYLSVKNIRIKTLGVSTITVLTILLMTSF